MAYCNDSVLFLEADNAPVSASGGMTAALLLRGVPDSAFAAEKTVEAPVPDCGGRSHPAEGCNDYTWGISPTCIGV